MKLKYEFVSGDPNVNFFTFQSRTTTKRNLSSLLEVNPSQDANGNVKVITIADNTTHPEKVGTQKLSSCCATVSSVTLPRHRNTCVTGHTSVLLGSHETWMTRRRTNLRTSLVRSPKTSTWHDVLKHVSQVLKTIRLNNMIMERLTKFREIRTWNKEEVLRKKPTEKFHLPEQITLLDTDIIRSITQWESMCSRSSTQSTFAP